MSATRPYKILVVEDEGLIAQDIANRLEAMGHRVIAIVSTAEEAEKEAPGADVVLMDIRLDGPGDGIQAAAAIRDRCRKPVVFLTAHADRSTVERAKLATPFGYIVKPVQPATLGATLDMAVYRHHMECQLAAQRGLLDAVLGSVADAIVVAGPTGAVRLLNRAAEALTGWTQSEAAGRPLLEVIPLFTSSAEGDEFAGRAEDPAPLALLRGEAIEIGNGTKLSARNGRRMLVEGSAAPVHVDGTPAGVVVNLRDVSARLWEESQLRIAHKMEAAGRLAASVSGEYANALSVIRARAGRLMEQFPEYVMARRAAEEIEQAAASAEKVTRRLAVLGARQLSNPEIFSLNGLLRRTRKLMESVAGNGVAVAVQPDPTAGKVWVDGAQMEQVLMNLVIHASASVAQNSRGAARLLIETSNAEVPVRGAVRPFVRLAVTRSGREADAETLFDPSPLEDDRWALSIARNIIAENGGYISASPVAEGYCFEVLLPRHATFESEGPVGADAIPSLLLVEPHEGLRRELQNFFEANGYLLLEASDAAEAVALADLHQGSLEVAIASRADARALEYALRETHPGLRIVEILEIGEQATEETSESTAETRETGGAGNFLRRPFTRSALLERVRELLGQETETQTAAAG